MEEVIRVTLNDYCKNIVNELETVGIKEKESTFYGEYYNMITESLMSGKLITQEVYNSIPDLHYYINKHYLIHGNNVICK